MLAEMSPEDPLSHYGVGLELIQLARWDDAARAFGAALTADSNYVAAYYHKGRAEIEGGHPDAARATLQMGEKRAIEIGDDKTAAEIRELIGTIE
ncbi:MAG: tetratricopeptide repeat protein [Phycisphaerae bacterium]